MGLMMMEFDPKKGNIAKSGVVHWKIKKITELSAGVYIMPDFLKWGRVLFSFRGNFLSHW
jgi:hypothetical protein